MFTCSSEDDSDDESELPQYNPKPETSSNVNTNDCVLLSECPPEVACIIQSGCSPLGGFSHTMAKNLYIAAACSAFAPPRLYTFWYQCMLLVNNNKAFVILYTIITVLLYIPTMATNVLNIYNGFLGKSPVLCFSPSYN